MKLVLALALSMPAIAAGFGRATCEPEDSVFNVAPDGIYCSSGFGLQEGAVKLSPPDGFYGYDSPVPKTASGQECWDACVAELGCDGFVAVDMNPFSGCTCPRVKFVDHRPAPREFLSAHRLLPGLLRVPRRLGRRGPLPRHHGQEDREHRELLAAAGPLGVPRASSGSRRSPPLRDRSAGNPARVIRDRSPSPSNSTVYYTGGQARGGRTRLFHRKSRVLRRERDVEGPREVLPGPEQGQVDAVEARVGPRVRGPRERRRRDRELALAAVSS